jgi:hypothetical protein
MSYIGNTPISVAFLTDTFSGTGSQTAFTMTVAPANTSSILVAVTGVVQDPSTYSVSGTTLTFSAAPPSGTSNISVRYLGIPASGVTTTAYRTVTNFTATAGQTSFSTPSYTVGYIDVYRNGVRLVSTDFTATTGTTVVLTNACTAGDTVVTESFYVSSVLNAIPATAGSVSDSYIVDVSASKLTGSRTIPKGTMPAGSVLQVVSVTKTDTFSTTSTSFTDVTGLSASITPTSSSSKIFVIVNVALGAGNIQTSARLMRDATAISIGDTASNRVRASSVNVGNTTANSTSGMPLSTAINYLDSPASTSSITYKIQIQVNSGTGYVNRADDDQDATFRARTASTITVMEIAA